MTHRACALAVLCALTFGAAAQVETPLDEGVPPETTIEDPRCAERYEGRSGIVLCGSAARDPILRDFADRATAHEPWAPSATRIARAAARDIARAEPVEAEPPEPKHRRASDHEDRGQ